MPGAFLRIFENGGKALMEPAPLRRCCVRVEHGCQERVSEAHAIAVDLKHAGIDRVREPGGAALPFLRQPRRVRLWHAGAPR